MRPPVSWLHAPPAWLGPAASTLAVAALIVGSAWRRWTFLGESPFPLGVDGYYYAIQLRALLETGALAYPASPMGFWLLAPFAAAAGPIVGTKLGAAVLAALIAAPAFAVGRRLGGSRATGLLAAALATASAGSFYLSVEFVKNGIGLTVALTYLALLLRALEAPSRARVGAALLALIATILTHKMAAALAVVVTIPPVVVEASLRVKTWRRVALASAGTALALIAAIAIAAWALPGGVLGTSDLASAGELMTAHADWTIPALTIGRRSIWLGHEAAIAGALALVYVLVVSVRYARSLAWRRGDREGAAAVGAIDPSRPAERAVALAVAALAVVIALPWLDIRDPQGLGFRLRIAAFVPMALLGAALAGIAARALPRDLRTVTVVAFAVAWTLAQPARRDEGVVRTHPAMAAAVARLAEHLPPDAIVVCPERHIVFMAAWYARVPARLRPESVPMARRWRLMPLAFIGRGSPLDDVLVRARSTLGVAPPIGLDPRLPNALVLVAEPTWQWALAQLPSLVQQRWRRWPTI